MRPRAATPLCTLPAILLLLVWGLSAQRQAAAEPGHVLDPHALPIHDAAGKLSRPPVEAPQPLDPDAEEERCAACRLALQTTGQLAPGSLQVQTQFLGDGVALRLTSGEPQVRDTLWKATLARGDLLAALRAGDPVDLCSHCKARRASLGALEIGAQRVPEGVVLVYRSQSPALVHQIHSLARSLGNVPVQF